MRAALAAIAFLTFLSPPRANAAVANSVLPSAGNTAIYVVTEKRHDYVDNVDSSVSETVTIAAIAGGSFDATVTNGAETHRLTVKGWSGNTIDTYGVEAGATLWPQDLNAIASLFSGKGAALSEGAHWTTQPAADTTAIDVPDVSRQHGTTKLLLPLAVHVMKSAAGLHVEGQSATDQGNGPTVGAIAAVKTTADYTPTGALVHAEGSISYGLSGTQLLFFTRLWTVDPKT